MWKIAIIDDDRQVLKGMKQVIPWEDIHAEWVGDSLNGARGLELIREKKPDIVITDIYMPVMNGLTMIEALHEENFPGKIVIHSGYSDFEVARKALRLNVEDYLSKPVSRHTLREVLGRAIAALENEQHARLEQDKLRNKLMAYEPFVRKERLKSLVTGTTDGLQEERSWLRGEAGRYMVLGIELLRTARLCDVNGSDRLLFRFAVNNILDEIVHGEGIGFDYIELHGYHAALLLHFDRTASYESVIGRIRSMAQRIIDCVQHYLNITIRIGIGGLKGSERELSDSMEEAFQFLSLEVPVLHPSGVFEYADAGRLSMNEAHSAGRPMKFYQHLVGDIKETQGKNAAKIIGSYISALKGHQEAGVLQFSLLGTQFWAILSYALNDEEIHLEELFQGNQLELELGKLYTIDQYEQWLNEIVGRICHRQEWHENFKHRLTIDFIKQYIHEHFDREITIAELAQKVFISRNYLCQIFKNGTGETINNYIISVKMEKAKGLLLERKHKIFEVAESVGYKNIPYFSTTFKKYFGVTPAEFIS
ncbi:response regulator [Paenibacillus piri]|uniref:Response regulator n=1 Tax=Paenibacillus piri TaxID=2547395 RepID=A0A4R5KYX3_9BACL|nr:response regulator [Paenibacillus piri]TDG00469.1 response regulator [Paenibacillus piri]